MLLLVGLGNPGPRYAGNRHNIGFMAVDAIVRRHGFGPWRRRFQGELAEGRLEGHRALALKPATYMNESGRSVGEALRFYKVAASDLVVFHDELDLAPGKTKVKQGGGHAGHNGLRSLIAHVGADFRRVRLGIGHPGDKDRVHGYVLSDFAKADAPWLERLLDELAAQAPLLARADDKADGQFMSKVNQAVLPPRRKPAPAKAAGKAAAGPAPRTGPPETAEPETAPTKDEGPLARALRRAAGALGGGGQKMDE